MEKVQDKNDEMTIDKLAIMVAKGFEGVGKDISGLKKDLNDFKLETKDNFSKLEFELKTEIHELRTDIKSFKNDTNDSIKIIQEDIVDLEDTNENYDKRIEKLESNFV